MFAKLYFFVAMNSNVWGEINNNSSILNYLGYFQAKVYILLLNQIIFSVSL